MAETAITATSAAAPRSAATHEFTGERVIPGQVDVDLWNEHVARYAFAARLSRGKRVLDIGCGTGYGAFELARTGAAVAAIDVSVEGLAYAREHYQARNLMFARAQAADIPFGDSSFDLVIALEVIEHLSAWRDLLGEVRRLLRPGGQFVVSTPNKSYYAESRRLSGPNPFHEHEFEYEEFTAALAEFFPHVRMFFEDHTEGILFQPAGLTHGADVRIDGREPQPESANFFIAVCAQVPQTGAPAFAYIPRSGNILREREVHIQRLEDELKLKNDWLAAAESEHAALVERFREQKAELEKSNDWAEDLDAKLKSTGERIVQLQEELVKTTRGYQARVAELESDVQDKINWAQDAEKRLAAESDELKRAVELLDKAEATVVERSEWAKRLDRQLQMVNASRWVRLGRKLRVGPPLDEGNG